jgi:hypothetical protein
MPLAYVQLSKFHRSIALMAIGAVSEFSSLSIPLVALLPFFSFRGSFTTFKTFWIPFGVEGYTDQNDSRVDVWYPNQWCLR